MANEPPLVPDPNDATFSDNVRSILQSLTQIDEELDEVKARRDAVFQRARDLGLSPKFLRQVHKLAQMDGETRIQQDRMLNVYRRAADIALQLDMDFDAAA